MLSKPTLYDKYHFFLEQQLSYQRWRAGANGEEGNHIESRKCAERANMFEQLLNDLRQPSTPTQTTAERVKRFESSPSNKELIYEYLKAGPTTIETLKMHACAKGRLARSMHGAVLKMVRDGELSRTGPYVDVVMR